MRLLRGYLLPAAMVVIGVALVVRTIFGGGGPVAIGIILGSGVCIALLSAGV